MKHSGNKLRSSLRAAPIFVLSVVGVTLLLALSFIPSPEQTPEFAQPETVLAAKLPTYFVKNSGQIGGATDFYVEGGSIFTYLDEQGISWVQDNGKERAHVRMDFVGAHEVTPVATGDAGPIVNYFKGDESNWSTDNESTTRLIYHDLWNGIDMVLEGQNGDIKYTFEVAPQADPSQIKLSYRGADLSLTDRGDLLIESSIQTMTDIAPTSNQGDVFVESSYMLETRGDHAVVTFDLGDYNSSLPLTIDPTVFTYASYFGGTDGTGHDRIQNIEVDSTGVYVGMWASKSAMVGIPGGTPGYDTTFAAPGDALVFKLTPDGSSMIYATYLGGSLTEGVQGLTVDPSGNAYITMNTSSTDYPTTVGAFDTTKANPAATGVSDVVVTKLSADGTSLVYSTYFGGDGIDVPVNIAVDSSGRAIIGGRTASGQCPCPIADPFPVTVGPDLTINNAAWGSTADGFLGRLNASGSAFDYLGYIGGSGDELGSPFEIYIDTEVDSAGNAYLFGPTTSTEATFPDGDGFGSVPGYDQTFNGGTNDLFMAKVDTSGSLVFATYIGGSGDEWLGDMTIDGSTIYFTANTDSTEASLPVLVGPDLTYNGGSSDAFIGAIDTTGTSLSFLGYLGGSGYEESNEVVFDSVNDRLFVVGGTDSDETTFPVKDGPDMVFNGVYDGFVTSFDVNDLSLLASGYIGGTDGWVDAYDAEWDGTGLWISGDVTATESGAFPQGYGFYGLDGFDQTFNGGIDAQLVYVQEVPAGVIITESGGSTDISEEGPTSDDYTVVLRSQPTFDVTVTISPNSQQTTDEVSLTFTPLDWDIPQPVVTTAVDDEIIECPHTGLITHTAVSQDLNYDGIAVDSVIPNISDNDCVKLACDSPLQQSICVSLQRFPDNMADAVILARDDLMVDAFTGTPFATRVNAPILLNPTAGLDGDVSAEISRVLSDPGNPVYLLGREEALSPQVITDLHSAGFTNTVVIGGENRDETAVLIAENIISRNPSTTSKVFVSENRRLVDALVAGAQAAELVSDDHADPIVLVERSSDNINQYTSNFLNGHPEISSIEIVGQEQAVSLAVEQQLKGRAATGSLWRTGGATRFDTARLVADTYFPSPDTIVVASGEKEAIPGALSTRTATPENFFNALLAGTLAADSSGPLLITRSTSLPQTIADYVATHAGTINKTIFVGVGSDLDESVVDSVLALI